MTPPVERLRKLLALATGSVGGEEARTAAVLACRMVVELGLLDARPAAPKPPPAPAPARDPEPPAPARRRVVTSADVALRKKHLHMLRAIVATEHPRAEAFREMLARMEQYRDRLLTERQEAWVYDVYRSVDAEGRKA